MHLLKTVLARLERLDDSIPVVLKDSDLLLRNSLSYFEDKGWHCLNLTDMDREFLTMLEAEGLAQSGRKVLVYIASRSEKELVFLAEYWDRGNGELVTAINLLSELRIDRKEFKRDFIVSLVRYGLPKEEDWWRDLKTRGMENVSKVVSENLWEILGDSSYVANLSEAEREFVFIHFANTTFGLKLTAASSPEEASTQMGEKILEASYKSRPGEELHDYYRSWTDSNEWGESILFHAERFEKSHKDELLKNIDIFEDDYRHPFVSIELELYERRIEALLNGEEAAGVIEFAKERLKKRKRKQQDGEAGIYWDELVWLEPLLSDADLGGIDSLESFLCAYRDTLWRIDSLDRKLRGSHLPQRLKKWASDRLSKLNEVISNHWTTYYDPHIAPTQVGLLERILKGEGKRAVIVVDALRYELARDLKLKVKAKIEHGALLAATPTETPVGMGALYSSGDIEKILKDNRVIVRDRNTGKTLDSVTGREENLKELVEGVEVIEKDSELPEVEKLVIKTRDIDSMGHDDLIQFYGGIMTDLSELADSLLKRGYEVHFTSDHGFYLPLEGETVKQDRTASYSSGIRYSLNSARPEEGKYEQAGSSFILYANSGNVFKDYGGHFWHGGITHQEVIIPHLVITPVRDEKRWRVEIGNKDRLKKLQKDHFEIHLFPKKELFGSAPRVYIQYLDERIELDEPVEEETRQTLRIAAKSGDTFKIEIRDLEDGSLLDWVECQYLPTRTRLF